MKQRIVISGMGAISALGDDLDSHLEALQTGRHGITKTDYLCTNHQDDFPVGEVKHSNSELQSMLNLPEGSYLRTSLLALFAARQLIENTHLEINNRVGFISATTVGGMDQSEHLLDQYLVGKELDMAKQHPLGSSTEFVAKHLGLKSYRTTLSTACSSSANAFILGSRLINQGIIDKAIVGGVDVLSKFTMNGFNSLLILDGEHCKPFDENRKGLNLGEAAAYLLIEPEESARKEGRKIWSELKGYANCNDAYHQTASSPEGDGAHMAMEQALKLAGFKMTDIDYINAHGTGTSNNDSSESHAIQRLFVNGSVPFSSTKAFTGHTLGAAGAIEAVISNLCIEHKFIPPSLNCNTPMADVEVSPVTKLENPQKLDNVLSNSFGFGGNNTTLIFSSIKS